jgi:hypothetical protein
LEIPLFGVPAVRMIRYTARNIGKQCNYVCYNERELVSAVEVAQPFPASVNPIRERHPMQGSCV